jgi:Phosphotransferase enzyme family
MKKINSKNVANYLHQNNLYTQENLNESKVFPRPMLLCKEGFISLTIELSNKEFAYLKQSIDGNESDGILTREMNFNQFLRRSNQLDTLMNLFPQSTYADRVNSIILYQYSRNSTDLDSCFRTSKQISLKTAEALGRSLATLHFYTANNHKISDYFSRQTRYDFPYFKNLLNNPTSESILTEAQLTGNNFIYYYQNSGELNQKVLDLISNSCRFCMTHNDLRLSNIISAHFSSQELDIREDSIIQFNDWGHANWGDPAYDLGSIIANYLLLWLHSMVFHSSLTLEMSLNTATMPLSNVQKLVAATTKSYLNIFPSISIHFPDFLEKIVQYSGLFLIYQLIYKIQSFDRFNDNDYFVLKMAAKLICDPKKSIPTVFGLGKDCILPLK